MNKTIVSQSRRRVKPMPPDWPQFDIELDCYWMAGTNDLPIYGKTSQDCLAQLSESVDRFCKHAEVNHG